MTQMNPRGGLQVAANLDQFVETEALPGTGIDSAAFWSGFDALVHELAPKNRALLAERDRLQTELDNWHRANPGPVRDLHAYRAFLEGIGYIVPVPASVKATTVRRGYRNRRTGRPATGRAAVEPALCVERGERALGQPVRRAVRHRRDSRDERRGKADGVQSGARRRGHRLRTQVSRSGRAARQRLARRRNALQRRRRQAGRHAEERQERTEDARAIHRLSGRRRARRRRCCSSTTACTSRSRSTRTTRSARPIPRM